MGPTISPLRITTIVGHDTLLGKEWALPSPACQRGERERERDRTPRYGWRRDSTCGGQVGHRSRMMSIRPSVRLVGLSFVHWLPPLSAAFLSGTAAAAASMSNASLGEQREELLIEHEPWTDGRNRAGGLKDRLLDRTQTTHPCHMSHGPCACSCSFLKHCRRRCRGMGVDSLHVKMTTPLLAGARVP